MGSSVRPFASVIVPVYNGEKTIARCIETLLAQDYPKERYEVIIVDNDSTDRTAELVRRCPVTYLKEAEIHTSYAARNTGARAARGEALVFCDADQEAQSDWLRELLSRWDDERFVAFMGRTPRFPVNSSVAARAFSLFRRTDTLSFPDREVQTAATSNLAVRAEAFWTLGGFNASIPTGEDQAFCRRLREATGRSILQIGTAFQWHRSRSSLTGYLKSNVRGGLQMELRRRGLLDGVTDHFGKTLARAIWHTLTAFPVSVKNVVRSNGKDEWDVRLLKPYMIALMKWAVVAGRVSGRLFGERGLPQGW